MRYVIVSKELGKSQLSYPTREDAEQAMRNAEARNPERVGWCVVYPLDPETHGECPRCAVYDKYSSHICLDRLAILTCQADETVTEFRKVIDEHQAEMDAVYLDAITPY